MITYKYFKITGNVAGWDGIYRNGLDEKYNETWDFLNVYKKWESADCPIFSELIGIPESEVFMEML